MTVRSSYRICALFAVLLPFVANSRGDAGDWSQWRGSDRDGVSHDSVKLRDALPKDGLKPLWISEQIPSARDGGWSSPVVAEGKVYLYSHQRQNAGEKLGRAKFPYLPPDKRKGMSPEQYEEYERNRRDEQELRSKQFRFNEVVYCLNAKTGKTVWKQEKSSVYSRFSQSGTPAVVDGKLFVLGAGRVARCVDANSGEVLWESRLPGEFRDEFLQASVVCVDQVLVVLCGHLFGLDVESGKVVWEADDKETRGDHCSPVVWEHQGKKYILVNVSGDSTVCVESQTGSILWRSKTSGGRATPIVIDDRLITYGNSRKKGMRCYSLDLNGPELVWAYQGAADSGSSPVRLGDRLFVQGERRLACVSMLDGKAIWSTTLQLNRPRYTSLVAADGKVFYAFEGILCFRANSDEFTAVMDARINKDALMAEVSTFRKLLKMDELERTAEGQRDAERLWRKEVEGHGPLPCTTPAIADGRLYVRLKSSLVCYDLSAR